MNAAGTLTTISPGVADDDGAPPALPPGGRVTTVNAGGDVVVETSSSPSPEQVAAAREKGADQRLEIAPDVVSVSATGAPADVTIARALVEKYPSFDPSWPAKTKAAWFDGFSELLIIIKGD